MKRIFRRGFVFASALAVGIAAGCGAYAGYLQVSGNFHTVIEGQLYRSAQPSAGDLASYVREHGIRTVINLRGSHPELDWYADEVAMSKGLGLTHIDFGMTSSKMLSADRAAELVAIMRAAPRPILIHCQAGADRSGLASALYMEKVAGQDEDRAERQLSFFYGHVGIPILSRAYAMDESWEVISQERHSDLAWERPEGLDSVKTTVE